MPPRQASTGVVPTLPGIQNLGNTCFLNSVVQALNATHPLPELLTLPSDPSAVAHPLLAYLPGPSAHPESPPSPIPITLALAHLFRHLSRPDSSAAIKPSTLIKELSKKREEYASYEQQDSHELLRVLVDGLRMEELDLWKALDPPPRPPPPARHQHDPSSPSSDSSRSSSSSSSSTSSATLVDPSAPPPPKREPLVDTLFCGALTQFIVCSSCRHVSRTTEDFLDLSLSLSSSQPGTIFDGDEGRRIGKRERFRRSIQDRLRASATNAGGSSSSGRSSPSSKSASEGSDASDEERVGRKARSKKKGGFWSREPSPARRTVSLDRGGGGLSKKGSQKSVPSLSEPKEGGAKLSPEKQYYLEKVLAEVPSVPPAPGHGVHALRFAHPDPSSPSAHSSSSSLTSTATATGPAGHETQLYTLLRQFTSVETLEGENVFACRNCWRLVRRRPSKTGPGPRARSDTIVASPTKAAHSSTESLGQAPAVIKSPKRPGLTLTAPSSSKTVRPSRRDTFRGRARDEEEASRLTSSSDETGGSSADAESDGGVVGGDVRRKKKLKPVVAAPESAPSKVPKPLQYVLRPAEKRYLVSSLPPVLVIHLKRFGHQMPSFLGPSSRSGGGLPSFLSRATAGRIGGGAGREASFSEFRKIDDFVSFPDRLDLTAFMAPPPPVRHEAVRKQGRRGTVMAGPAPSTTTTAKGRPKRTLVKPWLSHLFHHHRHRVGEEKGEDRTYRLYATVNHIGTLGAGHYVANVLSDRWKPDPASTAASPGGETKERRWIYASDTMVRMTTLDEVLRSKAYILFYERI